MPDNLRVLLVGTGKMGKEYCKVLKGLDVDFTVVGNSEKGCVDFEKETGVKATPLSENPFSSFDRGDFSHTINAVSIEALSSITDKLVELEIKNILLEKPAALREDEFLKLEAQMKSGIEFKIAFNRRFYASVLTAEEIIKKDGGITSFHFEFTEWIDGILEDFSDKDILSNWFACNSSHVVDLAFHLGGEPKVMNSLAGNPVDWHSTGTNFVGAGLTDKKAMFTYRANWLSAGRWGLELHTKNRKLILCPMEELKQVMRNSVQVEDISLDSDLDSKFKPGLYKMVEAFLQLQAQKLQSLEGYLRERDVIFKKMMCQ